jgi:hypothetical protein
MECLISEEKKDPFGGRTSSGSVTNIEALPNVFQTLGIQLAYGMI